ncbi:MAG TPA: RecX family transcriptional regulator [Candidatus Saccharimonadales bacterium]
MIVTAIKRQVKRAGRVSIFIDGKYSFGLSDNALLDSKLFVGQELSDREVAALRSSADDDKIYGNAMRYAAMRLRSRWEIEQYLARKKCPAPLASTILSKLSEIGLIDDEAFAKAWVQNRKLLKPTSRRTIMQELRAKRVSEAAIEQVLANEVDDDFAALKQLIAKKRAHYPDRQKFMQFLARRGFQYDDIKRALTYEEPDD